MTTPEDIQDDDDGEYEDGEDFYFSDHHVLALRLILSSLRFDWEARDEALSEIGDCPDCQQAVTLALVSEACSALVGDQLNEAGDGIDPAATEVAVTRISEFLAHLLDTREEEHAGHGCEYDEEPPE
jgi:hypothetical protein